MEREDIRIYESVVIVRPSFGEPEIQQFSEAYTARLEQGGSVIIKVENWGKRKLAYEVKGERKGTYFCFTFSGTGNVIRPLENANRIDDSILKSMTLRIKKAPDVPEAVDEVEEPESAVV